MKLITQKTDNGYILKVKYTKTEQQDDNFNETYVFEDSQKHEKDSIVNLLYHILRTYDPYNKFEKKNVVINIEHGENYECEGCDICE